MDPRSFILKLSEGRTVEDDKVNGEAREGALGYKVKEGDGGGD